MWKRNINFRLLISCLIGRTPSSKYMKQLGVELGICVIRFNALSCISCSLLMSVVDSLVHTSELKSRDGRNIELYNNSPRDT